MRKSKLPKITFIGFILFIVALLTVPVFSIIGIIYATFRFGDWTAFGNFFRDLAVGLDQFGNISMQYLFNDIMIKKNSKNKFGNEDETISSVFGKNQRDNSLSAFGKFWNSFLNNLDENHSIDAIEYDEN